MKNNQRGFGLIWILLLILLLALLGFGGWRVYDARNTEEESSNSPAPAKSADETPKEEVVAEPEEEVFVISASLIENIADSIESGNTAALEGYMTNPITVVFAASEKGGPETPAEAVADLSYISSAVAPWDFELSEATLASYEAGDYGQYIGENAVVGQSADDYVISFKINNNNKIETMFVSANADLLL